MAAAAITTAAALERDSGATAGFSSSAVQGKPKQLPTTDPDLFKQGMTVVHPEYGPGKIIALSGSGKNRPRDRHVRPRRSKEIHADPQPAATRAVNVALRA